MKMMADRKQDQIDIENMTAKVKSKIDMDWIRKEWQSVAGLDDPRMKRLEELIA